MFENIFETVNSGFAQALYEDYLKDPASVPPEWRALFENGVRGAEPVAVARQEAPAAPPGAPAGPETAPTPSGDGSAEPIKGPALRLLENMEASLGVPTATSFRDVNVGLLWDMRKALNAELADKGVKLSFTHLIGWAIVRAVVDFPVMTHVVREKDGAHLRVDPGAVNFGLAVDVEGRDGKRKLLVPIVKQADGMSFGAFHAEYERLVAGARDGKLMPDAYMGGTITLTNPGTIGTVASVPRLMRGQGSIIATGAIRAVAGQRLMTISSTYDHRIIQGAESGMFLRRIDELLQGKDGFYDQIAKALEVDLAKAMDAGGTAAVPPEPATRPQPSGDPVGEELLYQVAAAMSLVRAHRTHGYLAATLDPLGTKPTGDPALDPAPLDLTDDVMRRIPAGVLRVYVDGATLYDALPRLRAVYCGNLAYEIEHIASHEQRVWLRQVIESGEHRVPPSPDGRRRMLDTLTRVEGLETFLHRAFLGQKRFSIEGLDMLVPMLHEALELAREAGCGQIAMGMAHRGRLNVLAHVLGRSYATLLAEFEGGRKVEETLAPAGGTGDVKYHHGATGEFETRTGGRIAVQLLPNPSHLEAVDPVVEGWTRARQSDRASPVVSHHPDAVLPILIHGDAAFAAQGVVAETINLSKVPGYGTGGTLHIIANNQLGFTTAPREGRSTDFASDLAKGFDVPVIHVNADDPEACLDAVRLAMAYRAKFAGDVVVNLVGYRRHGHNEADEPRYTQPDMYELIDDHPTVRELYLRRLVDEGVVTDDGAKQEADAFATRLQKTKDRLEEEIAVQQEEAREPVRSSRKLADAEPATAVDRDTLARLNTALLDVPDGFAVNRKLQKAFQRRRAEFTSPDFRLDWAHGEQLALATLLAEGVPVRLTGQDTERGTFSHRHAVLHDADTGERYVPLQHVPGQRAAFEIHNSPLSEYACLGFEYGYAVAVQDGLVLWEAQFGDFVNGAEIVIDQFIVAGYAKWGQTSRLTLLLPHGYEGQGPEHSSGRLERFLALAAEHNIRVANCSTPAQYYHLLRRQALHDDLRPLVIMTPKSLLRLPAASSALDEFTGGRFRPVIDDPDLPGSRDDVTRLVFCSGKLFYDLTGNDARPRANHVAISRIELLYPFPSTAVMDVIETYPKLEEIVWAQEEPQNLGARKWSVPRIGEVAPEGVPVRYVSRPERASPAEGYPKAHQEEQQRIVREVLAG